MSERGDGLYLRVVMASVLLIMAGCINITTRQQPEDTSVKEVLYGEDCAVIIFIFGYGTASVEQAMAKGGPDNGFANFKNHQQITKIRRVELNEAVFLLFGKRCVRVVGE
jgi:hypothetical protein